MKFSALNAVINSLVSILLGSRRFSCGDVKFK